MIKSERGAAAVEMVLMTPVLLCFLLLVVEGGRLTTARNDVDFAARAGARAASIARSPASANKDARAAIEDSLNNQDFDCSSLDVEVDTTDFRPGGQATTTLRCKVDLSMASLLGLPMTRSVDATFTEPIDLYQGINP